MAEKAAIYYSGISAEKKVDSTAVRASKRASNPSLALAFSMFLITRKISIFACSIFHRGRAERDPQKKKKLIIINVTRDWWWHSVWGWVGRVGNEFFGGLRPRLDANAVPTRKMCLCRMHDEWNEAAGCIARSASRLSEIANCESRFAVSAAIYDSWGASSKIALKESPRWTVLSRVDRDANA